MPDRPQRVLVVAPHADDETLGVGGTMARLAAEGHEVVVAVLTGEGPPPNPYGGPEVWETVRAECRRACEVLGVHDLLFRELPSVQLVDQPMHVVNAVTAEVVDTVRPDVVFVPFAFDLHRDHREVFHSMSVLWRPYTPMGRSISRVYAYETLSETHLNAPYLEASFTPNHWFDISGQLDCKLEAMACYESQVQPAPGPRSLATLRALATFRGSQIGATAAEAFVLIRSID